MSNITHDVRILLKKVNIKGYKGISDATFKLNNINLFVGANNSGKTSFISAVHFAITTLGAPDI